MVFFFLYLENCLKAMSAKELFSSIIKVLSRTSVISLRTAGLIHFNLHIFHRNCDWHKATRLSDLLECDKREPY
jgi:hypothetical protein